MDRGRDLLHRARDVDVVVAVEVGMDAALEAHLGRAALDRLDHAALHLLHLDEVGLPAQVERERTLRERAEPALERADVRVVDVAVAHEGDLVADDLAPQLVGDLRDPRDLGAARRSSVTISSMPTSSPASTPASTSPTGSSRAVRRPPTGTPAARAQADRRIEIVAPRRPGAVACEPFDVGGDEHRRAHVGVQPLVGVAARTRGRR